MGQGDPEKRPRPLTKELDSKDQFCNAAGIRWTYSGEKPKPGQLFWWMFSATPPSLAPVQCCLTPVQG